MAAALGVTVLLAFALVPALAGAASASPALAPAVVSSSETWAYGGQGWSNNTIQIGNATATWDAWFGWTVVFTATNTSVDTVLLEEQRTVGVQVTATYKGPIVQASYFFHAQEVDTAFVNLTNQSTVYVNDVAVPAIGVDNVSAYIHGALAEMVNVTIGGHTRSASLTVNGQAQSSVTFSPSLGIVPLNLSGVSAWNSTATAAGQASWGVNWTWVDQGFNGTTGTGSGSRTGQVSSITGLVSVNGYKVAVATVFPDHHSRVAVVIVYHGLLDNYDLFVFVPQGFDLFGGAAHPFDSLSYGSASIASGETLYLGEGPRGPVVQAATTTFGASDAAVSATPQPVAQIGSGAVVAAAPSGPQATVTGYPMSVEAAQAEANCLTGGCNAKAASGGLLGGILLVAVVALVAIAVVGTVGVIEWRSYAARKQRKTLVGGYGESWQNGVPPAGAFPGAPMGPNAPVSGPSAPEEPPRHL